MKSTFEVGGAIREKGVKTTSEFTLRARSGVRTRSGVSLLISIVLISIVMVFAIGINNLVTSSLRQTSNVNRSTQAFYAAEGALESGLLVNQTMGAGYTTSATPVTLCATGLTCPTANVTIQGKAKTDMKYMYPASTVPFTGLYGMPTPGTGTVGSNCNPLTAYYDKAFRYPDIAVGGVTYAPWEHPCNWNKLKVGESVAIPLYTVTDDPNAGCSRDDYLGYWVCNPADLKLNALFLRVRTPCVNGSEFCPFTSTDRYQLDNTAGDPNVNGDDTILAWQIIGTSIDHKTTYTLKPRTDFDALSTPKKRMSINSEIYEGLINSARTMWPTEPFRVLKGTNAGQDLKGVTGFMIDFLKNTGTFAPTRTTANDYINMPVLKLTLVHSLDAFYPANTSIPYLEYQLLLQTNSDILQPADTSQTITAEGVSGTFKQVLEVKQPQETGLLEYVIQQ